MKLTLKLPTKLPAKLPVKLTAVTCLAALAASAWLEAPAEAQQPEPGSPSPRARHEHARHKFSTDFYLAVLGGSASRGSFTYNIPGVGEGKTKYGDGYVVDAAFGWRIEHARLEIGVDWRRHDSASAFDPTGLTTRGSGLSLLGLNVLGYYDFATAGPVRPYIGGGFGAAAIDLKDGFFTDSDGAAYLLKAVAGVSFDLGDKTKLFVQAAGRDAFARTSVRNGAGRDFSWVSMPSFGGEAGLRLGF